MSLLGSPLSKGMLVGWGVLLLALAAESGLVIGQAKKLGALQTQSEALRAELAQGQVNLKSCASTREALRESVDACIREVAVAKDENAQARQSIDQLVGEIRRETESVQRERAALFNSTPSCHELAALDIHAMCPGIADSMRARAARMSTPREGTNANPGIP